MGDRGPAGDRVRRRVAARLRSDGGRADDDGVALHCTVVARDARSDVLLRVGLNGFAERAARELSATGETVRAGNVSARIQLTDQELNVARLARHGLTNRDVGGRLFISGRTTEYHLHKGFMKLRITSRAELEAALSELDQHCGWRPPK